LILSSFVKNLFSISFNKFTSDCLVLTNLRFNQMKHYMKLLKAKSFIELKENLKKSIKNIKDEHYKNYFIYAYNKEYYKDRKSSKKSSKHRELKNYKVGI